MVAGRSPLVARFAVLLALGAIGSAPILVGVLRPPGLWFQPRIQHTVRMIGDTAMSGILIGLGVLGIGAAVFLFVWMGRA